MTLTEVLELLDERGLLDRAQHVQAGDVSVSLAPPVPGPPGNMDDLGFAAGNDGDVTDDELATLYGAGAAGFTPGATPHFEPD